MAASMRLSSHSASQMPACAIDQMLCRPSAGGGVGSTLRQLHGLLPFAQLVHDAPAGQAQQPVFEVTFVGVVLKRGHAFHYRDNGLLDDILGFGISQAGFDCRRIDQLPVRIEKDLPALLVVPILQPAQQRLPSRNQFAGDIHFTPEYGMHPISYTDRISISFRKFSFRSEILLSLAKSLP